MNGEVEARLLRRIPPKPRLSTPYMDFEAKVRYLASSLIVTIPARVAREMGIRLGDRIIVRVMKKEAKPASTPRSLASSRRRLPR
ncbi:MAG TPA: AbrB/MazE/SpoVT family DNA-binding domain-containing protein [Candidatus Bathyarchaeota archaeon]|nr:AbrB/MazE/SpoVT family DNA-binding domain-containing protein [Candidatus Bathyarchaeota archaeon]